MKKNWHILGFAAALTALMALPLQVQAAAKKVRSAGTYSHTPSKKHTVVWKKRIRAVAAPVVPAVLSYGQLAGLHTNMSSDHLALKSSVALVMDQDTQEILFRKNDTAVLPIASITKLMTGLLIVEANLPMDEMIAITEADIDTEKGSRSRLKIGSELSRGELLHLALMASENRAAHALGRSYPGGLNAFVFAMNERARLLGMRDTSYVDPTGLSSRNQSSAKDLALLVDYTSRTSSRLREFSTSVGYQVDVGNRTLSYSNTNRLVSNPSWEIGLQKTGYISEAGRCLVMQAKVAGRRLIMVFLDSAGKLSRLGDAERVKRWVESIPTPNGQQGMQGVQGLQGVSLINRPAL
ncbi:MAG: hypothetical protein RIR79_1158 [Pseudomonadota bacterium]|jgi:D-alanyl-D-alanine endopeptidase (penicillin-binding protein 7)